MDKYGQITKFTHFLIRETYLGKNNLNFIDLTCGNGYDTLFLSDLAGSTGQVIAFDIQAKAIERTKEVLEENSKFHNYSLIKESHEFAGDYIREKIDVAVFNLGYLPQSNKEIVTKPESTIKSLESLLPHLKDSGRIYIVAYLSHDKGYEMTKISKYLQELNKKEFNVLQIKLINKENEPPELFIIEKNT